MTILCQRFSKYSVFPLNDKGKNLKQHLDQHGTLNSPFETMSNEIGASSHPPHIAPLYYHLLNCGEGQRVYGALISLTGKFLI